MKKRFKLLTRLLLLLEFLTANYTAAAAPKAKRKTGGWELLPRGHVKLDVGASFDDDLLVGTAGAIIRDDKGNFIIAGNWKLDFCYDVLSAEGTAL